MSGMHNGALRWENEVLDDCIDDLVNERPIGHLSLNELDKAIGGVRKGTISVVCGAPGSGKSTLANAVKDDLAAQEIPVLFISFEMPEKAFVAKSVSSHSDDRVSISGFAELKGSADLEAAIEIYRPISRWVCHIDADEDGVDIHHLVEAAVAETQKPVVVIVDYLQLMPPDVDELSDDERTRVKSVMKSLRRVARKFGSPVFALSAINRTNYGKQSIDLDAISSSSFVEYGADQVLALSVPGNAKERTSNLEKAVRPVNAAVIKNRYGRIATCPLLFHTEFARFSEPEVK